MKLLPTFWFRLDTRLLLLPKLMLAWLLLLLALMLLFMFSTSVITEATKLM